MPAARPYASRTPDAQGLYRYGPEEDAVWSDLVDRQMAALPGRIAPEFLRGVEALGLTAGKVPQVRDIDARLRRLSGAGVEGVPAIIPPLEFFTLLSRRRFPVATFLRRREDMDYIEEPDLFHEVFGHCPMLTDPDFADFIERVGRTALALGKPARWPLFRLFWFTVEFGMIDTPAGLRGYGAGIASSPAELAHATGGAALIRPFDLHEVLRTPYRIDILQPVYFAIEDFAQLKAAFETDIGAAIGRARAAGDLPPMFDRPAAE